MRAPIKLNQNGHQKGKAGIKKDHIKTNYNFSAMKKNIFVILFTSLVVAQTLAQTPANSTKDASHSKQLGNGLILQVEYCIGDSMSNTATLFYSIRNIKLPNQKVMIDIAEKYPSMAFDDAGNKFYHNKIMLAGITAFSTLQTQIPTDVAVWGSITFFDVVPGIRNFSLLTFPVASSNFNGKQELKHEWVEIKNVPVYWNKGMPDASIVLSSAQPLQQGSLLRLNNGLDFTFTKCEGDVSTQLTTIYFTVSNNTKANVKIKVDPWGKEKAMLIDNKGNNFMFHKASLSNSNYSGAVETDLPTGVTVKGSISFRNMLPENDGIALLDIPLSWKYVTEPYYYDVDEDKVQLRNIKINWNKKSANTKSYPYLVKNLDDGLQMFITGCKGNKAAQTATVYYAFYNKSNPIQRLNINPWERGKSSAIDESGNQYTFDKNYLSTTISNGTIEKVLPTNIVISGAMSFKNVLPEAQKFTLVNLPVNISNWKGNERVFDDMVMLRDLVIDWDDKTTIPTVSEISKSISKPDEEDDEQYKKAKKLVSGSEFIFTECQGDIASQSVTIFFKINNPGKAHQKLNIDPWFGTYAKAIDENGNDYKFGNLNLGRQYGNGYLKAELPSGLFVNGFITFNEVEQTSKFLNLVNIPIYCKNRLDNNEKDYEIIELRNVKINWQ